MADGETDEFDDFRVFVYGTLQPGGLYWDRFCEGRVEVVGRARIRGRLYDLPVGYPGVWLEGPGWVRGVVLDLAGPGVLRGIDGLEGFDPEGPVEENEYERRRVEAFDEEGNSLGLVWAYGMSPGRIAGEGGSLVENGVWPFNE